MLLWPARSGSAPDITSGNALYGDLMALYKFGKWSVGPVGYFEVQTTADYGGCDPAPGVTLCGKYQTAAARCAWSATISARSICKSGSRTAFVGQDTPVAAGNINVWTRIGFRLWGPEAPKPLVYEELKPVVGK